MEYMKITVGRMETDKCASCICLNYDQFILDSNRLTDSRYEGFNINPNERFNHRVEKILYEILNGKRDVPCRFTMRLERRHSICNCRIDYVFEVMEKAFLKANIRAKEIPEKILKECLKPDVKYILLYAGMNK